jgi:PAS domain S-box-containing protein
MIEVPTSVPAAAVATLMEFALDAAVTKTRQGMITGWSSGAVSLYGYQPSEIIGRHATVLLPAGSENEEAELLQCAASGERITPYSTNRVRQDGTVIAAQLTMAPIVDECAVVVGWFPSRSG